MVTEKRAWIIGISMAVAGLIAFFIYNALHFYQGYWSVITVAAVMAPTLSRTLNKMLMRMIGTVVGAHIAFIIAWISHGELFSLAILLFIFVAMVSYFALTPSLFTYAAIVANLTIVLVLGTGIETHGLMAAIEARVIEIFFGIFICAMMIPIIYKLFLPEKNVLAHWKRDLSEAFFTYHRHPINQNRLMVAIKISLAASSTFFIWLYFRYPGGFWAPISCFFIMEETSFGTMRSAGLRFVAHVIAALVGSIFGILLMQHLFLLALPLALGFILCGFLIGSSYSFSTMGNTLGIALTTMLLVSPGPLGFEMTMARFLNVCLGIAVGLVITRYFMNFATDKVNV